MTEPRRCTAHSAATGQPCKKTPIVGGNVCRNHGGGAPQVKAAAAARAEAARLIREAAFDPAGVPRDPGEVLLAMLAMTHARVAVFAQALAEQHAERGVDALLADSNLAKLERDERDRAGRLAKTALDAGIAERHVRLAERQGELLVLFTEQLLVALSTHLAGLTPEERQLDPTDPAVRQVVHQALLALEGGPL